MSSRDIPPSFCGYTYNLEKKKMWALAMHTGRMRYSRGETKFEMFAGRRQLAEKIPIVLWKI